MIIGLAGKKQSGKDTVGNIIQYLIWKDLLDREEPEVSKDINYNYFTEIVSSPDILSGWKIKKFADKLKDIVCLLINCTREQLEDGEFKEKELGEEWWYWKETSSYSNMVELYSYSQYKQAPSFPHCELIKLTPRLLLQLLGTECGRQILHPNIWVNALMSEYYEDTGFKYQAEMLDKNEVEFKKELDSPGISDKTFKIKLTSRPKRYNRGFPNWIITDTRFPNELKAVKDRGGISIRVNRDFVCTDEFKLEHPSETALDNAEFDYVIDNNDTIETLIEKVRKILTIEGYIKRN